MRHTLLHLPHHSTINLILASPIRRTIQTAAHSFGPALARPDVPFILLPALQEVSDLGADKGLDPKDLESAIEEMFGAEGVELGFDWKGKIDRSQVTEGWNSKEGYWAYTESALEKRASDFRNYLFQRPENHIVLVTHGAIAHFITEDRVVDGSMTDTAYSNGEVREFFFTKDSTASDAHLQETAESRKTMRPEEDRHVIEELKGAVDGDEP